jgi:hypothetical protein
MEYPSFEFGAPQNGTDRGPLGRKWTGDDARGPILHWASLVSTVLRSENRLSQKHDRPKIKGLWRWQR